MKQYWQRIAQKADALSLRERIIVFAMVALVLLTLMNTALLEPQYARQKQLAKRIQEDQAKVIQIQVEIQQKRKAQAEDPDAANRTRLQELKRQVDQMHGTLQDMQKGLVSPDKMTELLDGILKRNGKLRLLSLKTLAATSLNESAPINNKPPDEKNAHVVAASAKAQAESAPTAGAIYKHGVELTVQGGYLDMLDYMAELERMPWQLFWGKAKLDVETYPKATLTLTLFTLSLDKRWLNI